MRPLSLLLASLCAAAHAQCVQLSQPPFAGGQFFLSLEDNGRLTGERLKCEGFSASAPVSWPLPAPLPTTPDFDLDRAFRRLLSPSCSIPASSPLPDIDAISLGIDWVQADPDGFVAVNPNAWGTLTFAVSRDAQGRAGSAVSLEARDPGGPGADLFSYVLRGSVMPSYLVGRTVRAQEAGEMGLTTDSQIDALDQMIPMYRTDPAMQSALGRLPANPTLYFSVTAATVNLVPTPWWGGIPTVERTGGVIFQTTWTGQQWGCVLPWRYPRQLGLSACEDIDALALEASRGVMLISTVAGGCVRRDQILFVDLNADAPTPVPYQTTTSGGDTPVSADAGLLGADDVRAICSLDPVTPRRNSTAPINVLRSTIATPTTSLTFPGIPRTLHGTMFLACHTGGAAELATYGLGWPREVEANGLVAAFLTVPGFAGAPVPLAVFARNPRPTFCGDPQALKLPIPPHLRLQAPAVRIEISWLGLNSNSNAFGQAHPLSIEL
ncbi:MAG: hypothetical protein R3F56_01850 [Planctomycetota bacterium]